MKILRYNISRVSQYLTVLSLKRLLDNLVKEKFITISQYKHFQEKLENYNQLPQIIFNKIIVSLKIQDKYKRKIRNDFQLSNQNLCLSYTHRVSFAYQKAKHEHGEELEKYCWSGHNTYPFPKFMDTINKSDYIRISKKTSNNFIYLAKVSSNKLKFSSIDYLSYNEFLKKRIWFMYDNLLANELSPDETFIPIHFLQIKYDPFVKDLIKKKVIRIQNIEMPAIILTSSRTLIIPDSKICLKLPVNIQITSERRLIFQANCHNAPIYSHIMKQIVQWEHERFDMLQDMASIRFFDYNLAQHLCCIFRDSTLSKKLHGNIFPANFIFERISFKESKRILDVLFEKNNINSKEKLLKFFEFYVQSVAYMPILIYLKYGIGLEVHLQNIFLLFNKALSPSKILIRDLDNVALNFAILQRFINLKQFDFHPYTKYILRSDSFSMIRLYHSMVLNNFAELVTVYSCNFHFPYFFLWKEISNILDGILKNIEKTENISKARINEFRRFFFAKSISTKALLKMKIYNIEKFKTIKVRNVLQQNLNK